MPPAESPLWACSAPQQPWFSGTAISGQQLLHGPAHPGEQAPLEAAEHQRQRRAGVAPLRLARAAGACPGATRGCAQAGGPRRSAGPAACGRRPSSAPGPAAGGARPRHWWSRHVSSRCPYCTPAGHTGSQARQPRQNDASFCSRSSSGSSFPVSSARISVIRPRGDEPSSLVSAYVGQAGRQNPQEMQRSSSCGSKMLPPCAPWPWSPVRGCRAPRSRPGLCPAPS